MQEKSPYNRLQGYKSLILTGNFLMVVYRLSEVANRDYNIYLSILQFELRHYGSEVVSRQVIGKTSLVCSDTFPHVLLRPIVLKSARSKRIGAKLIRDTPLELPLSGKGIDV